MAWLANKAWLVLVVLSAAGMTGLAIRYARSKQLIDLPGLRRSHDQATVRGGGIAILITFSISLLIAILAVGLDGLTAFWFLFAVLPIGLLGWLDDHRSLGFRVRLLCQAVVATLLLLWLLSTDLSAHTHLTMWLLVGLLLINVLAICWMINLVNFMDGSNGLASMQGLFCCLTLAWLLANENATDAALIGLILAASILGFLPWNWPRARVFMGDSGSYAIGAGQAALITIAWWQEQISLALLLLVPSVFLVDSTATLILRVLRSGQWYTAHREHAYQRLLRAGYSHTAVLLIVSLINLLLVLPAVLLSRHLPAWEWLIALGVALILISLWWGAQKIRLSDEKT